MKRGKLLLLYFLIVAGVTTFSFFVWQVSADKNHKISGYAWSENIGWVSLNCYNQGISDKCAQTDYGLDFNKLTKEFFGWAWSEYGGWLCFGQTCEQNAPDGSPAKVLMTSHGLLSGFAKWINLNNEGWLSLRGEQVDDSGLAKNSCKNCYQLKDEATETCELCFTGKENNLDVGHICEQCSNCQDSVCQTCSACFEYGLGVDFSNNTLVGWAWGGDQLGLGYGWLNFNSTMSDSIVSPPYLQTIGGDVYSDQGLGSPQQGALPIDQYSATFMLQSNGDIIHYSSECQATGLCNVTDGWVNDDIGTLGFPNQNNNYFSEFGPIDIKGLLAGQYGKVNVIVNDSQIPSILNGAVYYANNTLSINNSKNFGVGQNDVLGSGTIVVRGDLYLNSSLDYQNIAVTKPKNLPCLGIIVLKKNDGTGGNVYINPAVLKLVGNIYAENEIYTGTFGPESSDSRLTINGLLVAKKFNFQR